MCGHQGGACGGANWEGGAHLQERGPEGVFELQGIPLLSLPGTVYARVLTTESPTVQNL